MPEPENLKVEDLSKSVKQTPSKLQVMGCTAERYCLLHVVVQGPGSFCGPLNFLVRRTVAELRGVKVAQFSDFCLFSPYKTQKRQNAKTRFSQKTKQFTTAMVSIDDL